MNAPDASEDLVGALKPYFSAPIARALLTSTVRRAKIDASPDEGRWMADVVGALERVLPSYIADETRRGECMSGLRRLVAPSPGRLEPDPAPSRSVNGVTMAVASTIIRVKTADDVANGCEAGRDLTRRIGFAHVEQTKIATAISELARNILLYAGDGEIRIASIDAPRRGIEIAAIDAGPGIRDVELVMSVAYRSRTGMGMGLKGVRRLMDFFDIASARGAGTTIVVRKFRT